MFLFLRRDSSFMIKDFAWILLEDNLMRPNHIKPKRKLSINCGAMVTPWTPCETGTYYTNSGKAL